LEVVACRALFAHHSFELAVDLVDDQVEVALLVDEQAPTRALPPHPRRPKLRVPELGELLVELLDLEPATDPRRAFLGERDHLCTLASATRKCRQIGQTP
jgi:hypothetical protein